MPIFEKDGLKIFGAHIPKTGTSSINSYFKDDCGFKKICDLWHTPAKKSQATIEKEKPDHLFAIIRDPIDRIISEYNWGSYHDYWEYPTKAFLYKEFCKHSEVNFFIWESLKYFNNLPSSGTGLPMDHIRPQVEYLHKDIKLFLFSDWKLSSKRFLLSAE